MNGQAARDLVDAWSRARHQMDLVALSLKTGTATDAEVQRMEQLFTDFAGVIRVTVGTRHIEDTLEAGDAEGTG